MSPHFQFRHIQELAQPMEDHSPARDEALPSWNGQECCRIEFLHVAYGWGM
jgi:hypothetical protein